MPKKLGIYVHIPFCASKCGYCDFPSYAGCDRLMPKYHNALLKHIRESAPQLQSYYTDTVYFGGGTPTWYGARRLGDLFNAIKREALVYRDAEVTVEANPDSARERDLTLLRAEGFNRLSLGAQSANEDILKLIGRRHTWKQVGLAMRSARRAGFENISLDLIYGLPSQNKSGWADTLNRAIDLGPEHLSCYGLKLEPGTPMYAAYKDSPMLPDDDEQADMYLYTCETLERYGYRQYEISNFAKKGYQSRHNMKYWLLRDYMGFGTGAASCAAGVRYSYVKSIGQYISGMHSENTILAEYEKIGLVDRAAEYIMLGMRTVYGIAGKEYRARFGGDFTPLETTLEEFREKGWAEQSDSGRWHFTPSGFLLSNLLIGYLLDKQSERKLSVNPWMDGAEFLSEPELPAGDEIFYRRRGEDTAETAAP
ncbi:MAG: radical SAM family heme chaperone HemW [Oscillospiraceae bacterium]|nr:radical SAM family heme chaperone HemW [Oscillospiraceae bacterium]